MSDDDGWDWPMLIVLSYKYLGWDEEKFWKESPRRMWALLTAALDHESAKWGGKKEGKKKVPQKGTFIDSIPGWD